MQMTNLQRSPWRENVEEIECHPVMDRKGKRQVMANTLVKCQKRQATKRHRFSEVIQAKYCDYERKRIETSV